MSVNWVNGLDMLAQNGVLDYDAASYVRGVPPRYNVNPIGISTPAGSPPDTFRYTNVPFINSSEVATDEYNRVLPLREKEIRHPLWKTLMWGGLILITGGVAVKSIIKHGRKAVTTTVHSKKYKKGMRKFRADLKSNWKSIKKFLTKPWATTKAYIKKHPKLLKFCRGVREFFRNPIDTIKGWFKKP